MSLEQDVVKYYSAKNLDKLVLAALDKSNDILVKDLAPFDEFHIGSKNATNHLISKLEFSCDMHVLDIGCGIGGSARYVSEITGASVTGLDITPDFIHIARILSEDTLQAALLTFDCGSAISMPYADNSFDGAYMLHVGMNIQDKASLYNEVKRVLKPGAYFGIYDIFGDSNVLNFNFPVPWSFGASTSFLIQVDVLLTMLKRHGFEIINSENRHDYAVKTLAKMIGRLKNRSIALDNSKFPIKLDNLKKNVDQGLCAPWEIVCRNI